MTDRRRLASNGRVAHISLKGQVEADHFVEGVWKQSVVPKLPLLEAPDGARQREVLLGESVLVLEERDGHAFVLLQRDGYAGYLESEGLVAPPWIPTHFVSAARTYAKIEPDFKIYESVQDLSFGTLLSVHGEDGRWSEISFRLPKEPERGLRYYVPTIHLRALNKPETDPVAIAERFAGTPYLWGGNSAFGIDCSGLVQLACEFCDIRCPGDSDMQQDELGTHLPDDAPLQRGDLLFWKGHVAWVADPDTLIHANAYHMAVTYEPLGDAIQRIEAQGDGPVTARKRMGVIT